MNKSGTPVAVDRAVNQKEARTLHNMPVKNGAIFPLKMGSSLPDACVPAVINGADFVMAPEYLAEQAIELIASDSDEIT